MLWALGVGLLVLSVAVWRLYRRLQQAIVFSLALSRTLERRVQAIDGKGPIGVPWDGLTPQQAETVARFLTEN